MILEDSFEKKAMESSEQTLQQLMFSLIEVWKSSGKSQQEFCKEKELDYHKFQYWFRKHKRLNDNSEPRERSSFVSVKIKPLHTSSTGSIELIFPDGRKLIFHQPVEASFLRKLLV